MVKDKDFYKRLSKFGLKARWEKEHAKVIINKELTLNKIRINAYLCGDGWIAIREDKNKEKHYEIKCFIDNKELAEDIKLIFEKEFNVHPRIVYRRGCYHIIINNKPVCQHLLSLGEYSGSKWKIPPNLSKKLVIEWVKCFFDCEAYVNVKNKTIQVKSINYQGLLSIQEKLIPLGINSKVYGPYKPRNDKHSLYGVLQISSANFFEYKRLINFYHPLKKEKLNQISF